MISIEGGHIHQATCAREIMRARAKSDAHRQAGTKGGRPSKQSSTGHAPHGAPAMHPMVHLDSNESVPAKNNDLAKGRLCTETETEKVSTGRQDSAVSNWEESAKKELFSLAQIIAQKSGVRESAARTKLAKLWSVTDPDDAIETATYAADRKDPFRYLGACINKRQQRNRPEPAAPPPPANGAQPEEPNPYDPTSY